MDHCCLSIWCAKPNSHTRHRTNHLTRKWAGQRAHQRKDLSSLSKVGSNLQTLGVGSGKDLLKACFFWGGGEGGSWELFAETVSRTG